jgi:hypothetical protein
VGSIHRIDVNGNYCKDNCRWTGKYEQARNRRDTVYFDIHGVKTCLMDLVDTTGLTRNEIKQKFAQQIWSQ